MINNNFFRVSVKFKWSSQQVGQNFFFKSVTFGQINEKHTLIRPWRMAWLFFCLCDIYCSLPFLIYFLDCLFWFWLHEDYSPSTQFHGCFTWLCTEFSLYFIPDFFVLLLGFIWFSPKCCPPSYLIACLVTWLFVFVYSFHYPFLISDCLVVYLAVRLFVYVELKPKPKCFFALLSFFSDFVPFLFLSVPYCVCVFFTPLIVWFVGKALQISVLG